MHYFISDAHIRTDESYRSKLLVNFLRKMRTQMTHLYILGDLFEFWFEYNFFFIVFQFDWARACFFVINYYACKFIEVVL